MEVVGESAISEARTTGRSIGRPPAALQIDPCFFSPCRTTGSTCWRASQNVQLSQLALCPSDACGGSVCPSLMAIVDIR